MAAILKIGCSGAFLSESIGKIILRGKYTY